MKELQPNILNDYEHVVNSLVERYGDAAGFPQLETYNVTKELVEDYLFDYQAILDSEGSQRSQQTMYGIIALLPVILLSAFPIEMLPWRSETTSLMVGIGVGLVLALIMKVFRMGVKKSRLKNLQNANADVANYVEAIMKWKNDNITDNI